MSNLHGTHSLSLNSENSTSTCSHLLTRSGSESAPKNPSNTSADRPARTDFGGSHTNPNALSKTVVQSAPHRAWEEGYHSPFAHLERFHDLLDPMDNDTESMKSQYHTGEPTRDQFHG